MSHVLVAGAGGYIGVPLCRALLAEGHEVTAFDRFFFGREHLYGEGGGIRTVVGDIRDPDLHILGNVDAVIDLAGLSNDATAEIDPKLTVSINRDGGINLARQARAHGVKRYIYSSSAAVYGFSDRQALDETSPCNPQTEYARSKLAVEAALLDMSNDDFEITILRNATVFGLAERMRFDLAVNIMTLRAWQERLIYVMGGGGQWRPFIHISDLVRVFLTVLNAPGDVVDRQIFNVGSDAMNYRISQLANMVLDVIPNVEVHKIPDDFDKRSYNLSFGKLRDTLGFEPRLSVHDGIVEIRDALEGGTIDGNNPTFYTLQWYQSLIKWSQIIHSIEYKGRFLE